VHVCMSCICVLPEPYYMVVLCITLCIIFSEETCVLFQTGPTGMPDPNQPPYPGIGGPPGGYPPQPAGVRTCVCYIDEIVYNFIRLNDTVANLDDMV